VEKNYSIIYLIPHNCNCCRPLTAPG